MYLFDHVTIFEPSNEFSILDFSSDILQGANHMNVDTNNIVLYSPHTHIDEYVTEKQRNL